MVWVTFWVTLKKNLKKNKMKKAGKHLKHGGRGEIRTLGRFAPTQPFQGCTIGHSDTEPYEGHDCTYCELKDLINN